MGRVKKLAQFMPLVRRTPLALEIDRHDHPPESRHPLLWWE